MDRQFRWILLLGAVLGLSLGTYAGCQMDAPAPAKSADAKGDEKPGEDSDTNQANSQDVESVSDESKPVAGHSDSNHETPPAKPKPLLENWEKPKLAFVLTGEQHGYFEPCGCTSNQTGGVSRRADLVRQIKERGWEVTGLDLGGAARRAGRQAEIKFETTLSALKKMNYSGIALAKEELELGVDYLIGQSDSESPMFLGANLVFFDDPSLGIPLKKKVFTVNGVKVGVTAILDEKLRGVSLVAKNNADLQILPAEEALAGVVEELEKEECDLYVLLSHASLEQTQELVKKFPLFNLVLSAGGPEDPDSKPVSTDGAMVVNVGHKGKHVGVVGFYPDDTEKPLRFELVSLERASFEDTPEMVNLMREYQGRLLDEQLAGVEAALTHPSDAKFVGAKACGECHPKTYDHWLKTPHAHAFESLKDAREELKAFKGITRIYDPECLSCHVTGWDPQGYVRYKSGFINEEFATTDAEIQQSQLLKGQQCESCHGPGSKHIELVNEGEEEEAYKLVRVTLEQAKQKTCYECHDLDNSPHFEFDEYWEQVKHNGLDD